MLPEGISIARVDREEESAPRLLLAQFYPCAGEDDFPEVLARLVREHHLQNARCVSVLEPGTHSLLLIDAPDVEPNELRAAVRWRIKDLIDFHLDDAVIDVFEIPGQTAAGRARLMYVVAARASVIQKQVDLLQAAELGLSVIDIPELAMRNIASLLPENDSGVALLYLTSHGGLITLIRQSVLYLARNIETDTRQVLDTALAAGSEEGIDPGDQRFLDGIILEVQRSLDYYESHFSQPPITSLVITPLPSMVPGLVNYIAANLGMTVRMLDLNAILETEQVLSDELQSHCMSVVGAALRVERKTL